MDQKPQTGTLANSEDPDEMPHHQGMNCLLRQNRSSEKEMQYLLEIITCDPSIYTMGHPDLTVSNFLEYSIGPKRVRGWHLETGLSPPVKYFTDRSKAVLLLWIFYVFVLSCVCYVLCASVYMCFVVTCWESADLLALVCSV